MQHHFADLLSRDEAYWTLVPNKQRHAHRIGDVPLGVSDVTIVTIGKDDADWLRVFDFHRLEELTLHEPSAQQLEAIGTLPSIRRLRITHARPQSIDFIAAMGALEELVLEYVSGFSDLSPLSALPNLRSLHIENLRKASDFSGLTGITGLRYLAIRGTLDWQQPIQDFEFLRGLSQLEALALWQIKCLAPFPAALPAMGLRRLKSLRIHRRYLATEEYALLEECLAGVDGATWGPCEAVARSQIELPGDDARAQLSDDVIRAAHPEVSVWHDGRRFIGDPSSRWFEFTGRGAGSVKCTSSTAEAKCREAAKRYDAMKRHTRELIDGAHAVRQAM